jgi:hypothetical protein
MKADRFEVVVSTSRADDADSLEEQLRRAAIRVDRGGGVGALITVDSRHNGVYTAEDVLEVVAEWLEQRPDRIGRTSIAVGGSTSSHGLAALSQPPLRVVRQRRELIEW